jgi:excisionase family DNA binding protein
MLSAANEPVDLWHARREHEKLGRMASLDGAETLYSVREVADQLGVHPETIRRLIHDGRMDAVRIGRVLRVHGAALDKFLALQRVKPTRSHA